MLLLALACAPVVELGSFVIETTDDGALRVARADGSVLLEDLRFAAGDGDEVVEMATGAYRVAEGATTWRPLAVARTSRGKGPVREWALSDGKDDAGSVELTDLGGGRLRVRVRGDGNRVRFDAACTGDDRFVGLGAHAFDVEHGGEQFDLWVGEPGIGKVEDEVPPDDWALRGTRHASSFPTPFLIRPEPLGVLAHTAARVTADLCTDDRWSLAVWEGAVDYTLFVGDTPTDILRMHTAASGTPLVPPDWAFAPWLDAVGGEARVRAVAATLRDAGAPTGVIWTEDWKGAEETAWGYHLKTEWDVDRALYPEVEALDAELEAGGFKWLAYFSAFLEEGTRAWDEASAYAIETPEGAPYTFVGATLTQNTVLDLTKAEARAWAQEKMQACVDLGFDGWMADYGEWMPTDAVLAEGDAADTHNLYPFLWHATNAEVLEPAGGVWFTRSGWLDAHRVSPVNWIGDQHTGFEADDGLPTVVPMMLGTALAGMPIVTHDIAGYQTLLSGPSSEELWLRWVALGAFTPIMRTHHGTAPDENTQFDTNPTTLAAWTRWATEHTRLFPYRRGLVAEAVSSAIPTVRPLWMHHPAEDWGRTDAYLLGPHLLVAPVVTAGVSGRDVALPADAAWYRWSDGAVATSGWHEAPVGEIPVFAPAGAVIPMYTTAPDTLVDGPLEGVVTRSDVEGARTVRVYAGRAGGFTEADGTTYQTDGVATGSGTATATLSSGTIEAGGLRLEVSGADERVYTLEVFAP